MKNKTQFFPFHNKPAVAVALTFMIMSILYGSWIARLPDIQQQLNLSEAAIGIALSGLAAGSLLGTPFSVFVLRKMSIGQATFWSILLLCFAFALPTLAVGKWSLAFLLALAGLSDGLLNISMNSAASALEKQDNIKILSTCHGMFSVGLVIGALTAGTVSQVQFSFQLHMIIVGVLMGLLALYLRPYLLRTPDVSEEKEKGFVFPPKAVLGLGLICACFTIGEGAIADWSGIYLRENVGTNEFVGGLGLAVFSTGMAIGRFGGDKIRSLLSSARILIIGGLTLIVGMSIVVFLPFQYSVLFGFFVSGLGLSAVVPVLFSEAAKVKGVNPGIGLAAVATFSIVGFMFGPPLIGFVSEELGLRAGLSVVLALAFVGTLLIVKLRIED